MTALGKRLLVAAMTTLALISTPSAGFAQAEPSVPTPILGVYRGAAAPGKVAHYERWLKRPVRWALDFQAIETWKGIESPAWQLGPWRRSRFRLVLSVPMLPASGGTLASGAAGMYNEHFRRLARALVRHGLQKTVLRVGWEFNGSWSRWSAASSPSDFVGYWRQIVTTMRGVAPGLRFDWCPTLGLGALPTEQAWPGDAYVDYVGSDVYDQAWGANGAVIPDHTERWNHLLAQPYGLDWLAGFAAAHGKSITLPEWGAISRPDGHGGGDNPYFIQQMHRWILDHDVAYALYFQFDTAEGASRLTAGAFPGATKVFLRLFGTGS
jgi:glycosyl hydrolase family 26